MLGKIIISSGVMQLSLALIGIFKSQLIFSHLGVRSFATLSIYFSLWTLFALFGESERARMRQISSSNVEITRADLKERFLSTTRKGAAIAGVTLTSTLIFSRIPFVNQIVYTLIMFVGSIFYIISGTVFGYFEGENKFVSVNITITLTNLASIPFFIFLLPHIQSAGALVLFVMTNFLPGILIYIIRRKNFRISNRGERISAFKFQSNPFLVILFFETLTYSLDPLIVSTHFPSKTVTTFTLVSKLTTVYSLLPIALAPFLAVQQSSKLIIMMKKKLFIFNIIYSLFGSLLIFIFGQMVVNYISHGQIIIPRELLIASMLFGSVLVMTSQYIQRATTLKGTQIRSRVIFPLSLLNILLTYALLGTLGVAAPFLVNATIQLLYAFIIARKGLDHKN